ncbi:hypothetical protein J6590_105865 [Homalodisca vitripennis]|nr:hypothetical protein J6590_105865 [Homalodisca vitripennis]
MVRVVGGDVVSWQGHKKRRKSSLCLGCWQGVKRAWLSASMEENSSSIETPPTTSSSVIPALEEKKHEANPKNKAVSLRSLFGLGIGANLLGVHAGAGIGAKGLLANLREVNTHNILTLCMCNHNHTTSQQLMYPIESLKECH